MTRKIANFTRIALIVTLLAGCAASQAEFDPAQLARWRNNLTFPHLVVEPLQGAHYLVKPEQHLASCQNAMVSHLEQARVFKSISGAPARSLSEPTLILEWFVPGMHIVGAGSRLWGGATAGRSNIKVRVKLRDARTGKVVAHKTFDSRKVLQASSNPWVARWTFGATDRRLPEDMGALVARYVLDSAARYKL